MKRPKLTLGSCPDVKALCDHIEALSKYCNYLEDKSDSTIKTAEELMEELTNGCVAEMSKKAKREKRRAEHRSWWEQKREEARRQYEEEERLLWELQHDSLMKRYSDRNDMWAATKHQMLMRRCQERQRELLDKENKVKAFQGWMETLATVRKRAAYNDDTPYNLTIYPKDLNRIRWATFLEGWEQQFIQIYGEEEGRKRFESHLFDKSI